MATCMAGLVFCLQVKTIESSDYHELWTNIIHGYLLLTNDHALKLPFFPSPDHHPGLMFNHFSAMYTYHGSSHQTQAETWQDDRVACTYELPIWLSLPHI
jgi:hypothetical protein